MVPDPSLAYAGVRARILARERARTLSVTTGAPWRWGLPAAFVPIVVFAALVRPPAVLNADALLANATAAEREAGADSQDVAIEVTRIGFGHVPLAAAVIKPGSQALPNVLLSSVPPPARASVARLLAGAPFNVARVALSATTYQAWRATMPGRHDVVSMTREGRLLLRTETKEPTRLGELVLEPATYRVVQVTYVSDGLRIDARERAYRPAPRRAAVTLTVTALDPTVLDRVELNARLALRTAQADLGRGVQIARTPDTVRVAGFVAPAQHPALYRQLAALPHVRVELGVKPPSAAALPAPGLGRWQARIVGDTTFVPAFAERAARIAERVEALQELARRYPFSDTSRLPPDARRLVDRLATLHYRDLVADLREIRPSIGLLVGLGSRPRPLTFGVVALPQDWRTRSRAAATAVQTFSADVDAVLRRDDMPSPTDTSLSRSYRTLCDLVSGSARQESASIGSHR